MFKDPSEFKDNYKAHQTKIRDFTEVNLETFNKVQSQWFDNLGANSSDNEAAHPSSQDPSPLSEPLSKNLHLMMDYIDNFCDHVLNHPDSKTLNSLLAKNH